MPRGLNKNRILFPDEVILRTSHFVVAQDWEVPIKGFYIIASRHHHRRSILELKDDELLQLGRLQRLIRECMKTVLGISDAYFFQNEDSDHGFHVWIFPRHAWMDEIAGRKIESVRPLMDHAIENVTEIVIKEIRESNKLMRLYLDQTPTNDYLRLDLLNEEDPNEMRTPV